MNYMDTLLRTLTVDVHMSLATSDAEWVHTTHDISFLLSGSPEHWVSSVLQGILIIPLVTGAVAWITGKIREATASSPEVFVATHLMSTVFAIVVAVVLAVRSSSDTTQRGVLVRSGLFYALLTMSYTPLIIYIPKPGNRSTRAMEADFSGFCCSAF